jgi:hypothetical protein
MSEHPGLVDVAMARRLAHAIGTAKAVLMAITGVAVLAAMLSSSSAAAIAFAVCGVASIVSIYVLFGWFEYTLRLLVGIAINTAGAATLDPGVRD